MDTVYTIAQVALKLGLSEKTLRRWEESGKFRASRTLGNQRRYRLEDLQILDAIKHGIISKQSDLLPLSAAAFLCGVSPGTITRWEKEGKIHPFVTSGQTYYPKERLAEKLDELIKDQPRPQPPVPNEIPPERDEVGSLDSPPPRSTYNLLLTILANLLITSLMLLGYHLLFSPSTLPISPATSAPSPTF